MKKLSLSVAMLALLANSASACMIDDCPGPERPPIPPKVLDHHVPTEGDRADELAHDKKDKCLKLYVCLPK